MNTFGEHWPDPHNRPQGPILIEGEDGAAGTEWVWYTGTNPSPPAEEFVIAAGDRGLWGTVAAVHNPAVRILQPRTWFYVLNVPVTNAANVMTVRGDPQNLPTGPPDGAPPRGYIVIDGEWMVYGLRDPFSFTIDPADADGDGIPDDRGWGRTTPAPHNYGTPVTVARPHPYYPGFFYTVQFYPVNARGTEAHVLVSVGYGTAERFRVQTFRSVYSAAKF